jgi:hypothetical protein
MRRPGTALVLAAATALATPVVVGCREKAVQYGRESALMLPTKRRQVWAVAPAINLSGQGGVDPLLQADLAFEQLQQIGGLTVIPVNRVAQVYVAMGVENVKSPEQAEQVCQALGADGLVVPTITIYDPYNPPKFGGALQLFRTRASMAMAMQQSGEAVPAAQVNAERGGGGGGGVALFQSVGMYDAANGSVRDALRVYAAGRHDPVGPLGAKEYVVSMDRFCGFAYRALAESLLYEMRKVR